MEMQKKAPRQIVLRFIIGVLFFCTVSAAVNAQQEVINNSRVVELVAAGIGDSVLIPKIKSSRVIIDASQESLLKLKAAGVSDAVIVAMMDRAAVNGYITNGGPTDRLELPAGTELKVATIEKISGRKVTEGQLLTFKTAEDVTISGQIVIRKDTPVIAVVSNAKTPGLAGRGGALSVMLQSTSTVDGQTIKLRAAKSGQGGDNFGTRRP
jgi:hypothetical protein